MDLQTALPTAISTEFTTTPAAALKAALQWRYAVKQFSAQKLSDNQVKQLLEATCLSASGYGLQPYKILVIKSDPIRQRLLPFSYGQEKIATSSHLIVFAGATVPIDVTVDRYIAKFTQINTDMTRDINRVSVHLKLALSSMSPEQAVQWAKEQTYIALGNLLTSAALMQIDSCPMTGFDNQGYDCVLGLAQQGLTSTAICPIGYRHQDDAQATQPKVRLGYDQLVQEI